MTTPTLVDKLVAISTAAGHVAKTGKNASQGFNFRGIDAVVNALSNGMRNSRVIVYPTVLDYQYEQIAVGQNKALVGHVRLEVRYTFTDGIDSISAVVSGEAMDSGDKATNKALSIAYKYMAFQLFAIPIDEDPDKTTHELMPKAKAKVETLNDDDVSIIKELVDKAGEDEDTILNAFKVITWQEIPRDKFAGIVSKLQKKISTNEGAK